MRYLQTFSTLIVWAVYLTASHAQTHSTLPKWREVLTPNLLLEWNTTIEYRDAEKQKVLVATANSKTPTSRQRLWLQGNSVRYEQSSWVWNPQKNSFTEHDFLSSFNATESRIMRTSADKSFNYGAILNPSAPPHVNELTMPLLSHFRGRSEMVSRMDITKFLPTKRFEKIADVNCPEYEFTVNRRTTRLWFDPETEWSVWRRENVSRDHLNVRTDIRYIRESERKIMVPQTWTVTIYNTDGSAEVIYTSKLKSIDTRTKHSDRIFELAFPEGLPVQDQRVLAK